MTEITLELEKMQNIKNQLDILLHSAKQIENDNYQSHIEQKIEPLDKQEKAVLKFIKRNPGTSIQNVVESVDYARATIYKIIRRLRNYGMIIEELDEKNNRKHRLYVKDKSLIVSVIDDVESFKKSYSNFIRRALELYKKIEGSDNDEMYSWDISVNLVSILKYLIASYSMYAVFEWPKMIKDTQGLNRLYLTVFQSINEIFLELRKYVPFHIKDRKEKQKFLNQDLMFPFQESKVYEQMINDFHEYDLDKEFNLLMSDLFRASKMPKEWKNYRDAIMEE
jgi:predicted transcriptional regulator